MSRARAPYYAVMSGAALAAISGPLHGQDIGPVSVDSAAAIRASVQQVPGEPPFDIWDGISLPLDVVALPIRGAAYAMQGVLWLMFRPAGPTNPAVGAIRDVERWGLSPAVRGVGPRSGPGLELRLERFSPFFVRSAATLRTSQLHSAGFAFGDPMRLVTDVEPAEYLALGAPPPRGERNWGLEVAGSFRRYAEPHFWGIGPDSGEADEVDFRWDRWRVGTAAAVRSGALGLRAGVGWEENQVAPGLDDSTPDLLEVFDAAGLFGAVQETRFLQLHLKGIVDLTRWRGLQLHGFRAEGGPTLLLGVGGTDADFVRWDAALTGYVSLNPRQQLALHGIGVFHSERSGRGVPFTHLASLGGKGGLRGFDNRRFRDAQLVALMSEWRYEIWGEKHGRARTEGFVFLDAGTVAPEFRELDDSDLKTSWGFGMRAVMAESLVFLWYVGLGGEETQLEVGFSWPY